MKVRSVVRGLVVATILAMLGALLPQLASAAPEKASGRYLVRARSSADYTALRAKAVKEGARVVRDLKQVNTMVVSASSATRTSLAADRRTLSVARSGVRKLTAEVGAPNLDAPGLRGATRLKAKAPAATSRGRDQPRPGLRLQGPALGLPPHRPAPGLEDQRRQPGGDRRRGRHRPRLHPQRAGPQGQGGRRLHRPRRTRPICKTIFGVVRRGPGGRVRRPGDHRLERARLLDRRPHRRRPQRHRHQRDRPQGQPGRAEDLPVVRLGQRRRAPGRVHDRRRHGAGRRQHLLRRLHRHLHPRGPGHLPDLHRHDRLRPQQGHDHRRLGRQRARPGRRRRPDPEPRPALHPRRHRRGLARPVRPGRAARWGARRGRRLRDQPGQRPVLGQLPAGHHRRPGRPRRRPARPAGLQRHLQAGQRPRTRRPGRARRTSSPTTPTTARGSTSPVRAGRASSTCPTSTGAAPPGSPTPSTT